MTERIPVWKGISELQPGIQSSGIGQLREEGWVCLTATGFVVIGMIGYDLFTNDTTDWRMYAEKLAAIDWRRSGDLGRGNTVLENGKIALGHGAVRSAIQGVCSEIGRVRPAAGRKKAPGPGGQPGAVNGTAQNSEDVPDGAEPVESAGPPNRMEDAILEITE
jgi:hypothetical protein